MSKPRFSGWGRRTDRLPSRIPTRRVLANQARTRSATASLAWRTSIPRIFATSSISTDRQGIPGGARWEVVGAATYDGRRGRQSVSRLAQVDVIGRAEVVAWMRDAIAHALALPAAGLTSGAIAPGGLATAVHVERPEL